MIGGYHYFIKRLQGEQFKKEDKMEQRNDGINRAKWWQIAGLAVNDVGTNTYMWMMIFISYYLNGIVLQMDSKVET